MEYSCANYFSHWSVGRQQNWYDSQIKAMKCEERRKEIIFLENDCKKVYCNVSLCLESLLTHIWILQNDFRQINVLKLKSSVTHTKRSVFITHFNNQLMITRKFEIEFLGYCNMAFWETFTWYSFASPWDPKT